MNSNVKLCQYCEVFWGATKKVAGRTIVGGCVKCSGFTEDTQQVREMVLYYEKRTKMNEMFIEDLKNFIKEDQAKILSLNEWLSDKGAKK